jgi:hypothetical protein
MIAKTNNHARNAKLITNITGANTKQNIVAATLPYAPVIAKTKNHARNARYARYARSNQSGGALLFSYCDKTQLITHISNRATTKRKAVATTSLYAPIVAKINKNARNVTRGPMSLSTTGARSPGT